MPSEFDYLRVKWPKLAAIGADASRLLEASPSTAIASLRTFCEWATEITLDMYRVQVLEGAGQAQRLDALQATGRVPVDILQKLHNVRTAGNDSPHRALGDHDSARQALQDALDIAQWLFREAERGIRRSAEREPGPTPQGSAMTPPPIRRLPLEGLREEGRPRSGAVLDDGPTKMSPARFFRTYTPQLLLGGGVLAVIAIVVVVVMALSRCSDPTAKPPGSETSLPPTAEVTAEPTPTAIPTPAPEVTTYLDELTPITTFTGLFLTQWDTANYDANFQIADKLYDQGIGMFIPSRDIREEQGSKSAEWRLDGMYTRCTFDLGADRNWCYEADYGYYRIVIESNGTKIYESGDGALKDYTFTDSVELDLTGCQTLKITITQKKGSKGTLNIVLGDFILYSQGTGATETPDPGETPATEETPDPNETPEAGETATPAP